MINMGGLKSARYRPDRRCCRCCPDSNILIIGDGHGITGVSCSTRYVRTEGEKEGAMNRGAVGSRNRETGTDAPCPSMTTKKVAQKAIVVISICFFSGTLRTASGQLPTPSVTAIES